MAARAKTDDVAGSSSTAALLAEAHQLAETARTEEDFSKIFALCQQIPASTATKEEAAFGRQLAAWSLNRRGQLQARHRTTWKPRWTTSIWRFASTRRAGGRCTIAACSWRRPGQFEPAFDDFHHTIELNPSFAKAYSNRAALYVLAGELEPAWPTISGRSNSIRSLPSPIAAAVGRATCWAGWTKRSNI